MKKSFKNIVLPALALVTLPFMTSCSKDIDSNPTLQEPTTFHLNTPALALGGNVYDLEKGETLNLTTSQPDYGFPLATTYQVQISLNKNFSDKEYTTLESTYNKANMNVDAQEINNAVVEMFLDNNPGVSPSGVIMPIYVRLRAHITNSDRGYINSNVIEIPKVVVGYVASLPKNIFLAGSSIRNGESVKQLAQISGSKNEDFFGMFYVGENGSIKWGASTKANKGYKDATVNCKATGVTVSEAADGGIQFAKAGWYIIVVQAHADAANNKMVYTFRTEAPKAYIIGAAAGGDWSDPTTGWELSVPETADGEWVSPAFTAGGELRAYMKIPGWDWWHTEFTIYKKKIYYRDVNLIDSWAKNKGAGYSVTCAPGQKLHVNFDTDAMEVK